MMRASSPIRPRRLRRSGPIRALVRETRLSVDQFIMPLFVRPGTRARAPIPSLPGQFHFSIDELVREARALRALGIPGVLLFGLPERKDAHGRGAHAPSGIIPQAVRALKRSDPELVVITDVCLCGYTTHGHCGVLAASSRGNASSARAPRIDNDATVAVLANVAQSHAEAGADFVAPSAMMDGTVGAIRSMLDAKGFQETGILAYSVKYASAFYGPFREAAGSTPAFGDRRGYQMDPANVREAVRAATLDLAQGADILMVKPALAYLDVIAAVKQLGAPVAAFNVSGEYAMVKAAAARGWVAEEAAWREMLTAMTRAGADILLTYWAKEAARTLRQER